MKWAEYLMAFDSGLAGSGDGWRGVRIGNLTAYQREFCKRP